MKKLAKITKVMKKMKDDSKEYNVKQKELQIVLVRVNPHVEINIKSYKQ